MVSLIRVRAAPVSVSHLYYFGCQSYSFKDEVTESNSTKTFFFSSFFTRSDVIVMFGLFLAFIHYLHSFYAWSVTLRTSISGKSQIACFYWPGTDKIMAIKGRWTHATWHDYPSCWYRIRLYKTGNQLAVKTITVLILCHSYSHA